MTFIGFVCWAALTFVIAIGAFVYGGKQWQEIAERYAAAALKYKSEYNRLVGEVESHIVEVGDKLEEKRDELRDRLREEVREALDKLIEKLGA